MTKLFWIILEVVSISMSVILPLLLVIAYFTILERKVMASLQRRTGPNVHGYYGSLQPLIDGLKLLWKEMLVPAKANFYIFIFSPMFMMSLSFSLWAVLPLSFTFTIFDSKLSLITFFVISSLNIYNIILAGWSSNSKYSFLGSVRAMGQMFSYELVLGFALLFMLLTVGSLRIYDIVIKQYYVGYLFWPLLPFAIIFFISLLMETNRAPFDLSEAESELVAGYNVEYSSITFAMFFLGEYCNILAMSSIWSLLFWGGFIANYFGVGVFIFKILTLSFIFIYVRSLLPRYRVDQLIYVGWHVMLPVALGLCVFLAFIASVFNIFPQNSIYFNTTVPENLDFYALFEDSTKTFAQRKTRDKLFHDFLINAIIHDQSKELEGIERVLYIKATRENFTETEFGGYIGARLVWKEMGDPVFTAQRDEVIVKSQILRWRFNVARFFSEWLVTEAGKLPYGWSEEQYIDFMTGGKKNMFVKTFDGKACIRDFSNINMPGMVISLDALENLFVNDRFELPGIVRANRFLISPSKVALLSPAAQAKLDLVAPVNYTRDSARIHWIDHFSGILDQDYLKTKKIDFRSPEKTGSITVNKVEDPYVVAQRVYSELNKIAEENKLKETLGAKVSTEKNKTCPLYLNEDDLNDISWFSREHLNSFKNIPKNSKT